MQGRYCNDSLSNTLMKQITHPPNICHLLNIACFLSRILFVSSFLGHYEDAYLITQLKFSSPSKCREFNSQIEHCAYSFRIDKTCTNAGVGILNHTLTSNEWLYALCFRKPLLLWVTIFMAVLWVLKVVLSSYNVCFCQRKICVYFVKLVSISKTSNSIEICVCHLGKGICYAFPTEWYIFLRYCNGSG